MHQIDFIKASCDYKRYFLRNLTSILHNMTLEVKHDENLYWWFFFLSRALLLKIRANLCNSFFLYFFFHFFHAGIFKRPM